MKETSKNILVVDDEPKILEAIKAYLENSDYSVITSSNGKDALEEFEKYKFDLVILDLMLPLISGEEVCTAIRKKSRIPIIMLTAKVDEDEKISGFNLGADDYVTKPFSPRELMVRVKSLLRRCSDDLTPLFNTMSWNNNDLSIDFEKLIVKKEDREVSLTANEFKILSTMVKYPNKVFTREELIQIAFGVDYNGFERTIDSHIKNIRGKIESDSSNPQYIITIRGVGYRFKGEND